MMRQMLQRIGEIVVNGLKAAQAEAEQAGEQQQGPTDEQIQKAEEHQQKMQQAQEMHELKVAQIAAETDQKIAAKNAEAAAKVARDRMREAAKPVTNTKKTT